MSIEFHCQQCGQMLRTPDGTSGQEAKCPACGAVSVVPGGKSPALNVPAASPFAPDDNPYVAPSAQAATFPAAAAEGQMRHTTLDLGNVFSQTWEIYRANLGVAIGAVFIIGVISYATSQVSNILMFLSGNDQDLVYPLFGVGWVFNLVVMTWFEAGLYRYLIALARGQNVDFSMIFSGSPHYVPLLVTKILVMLAVWLGLILLIVPGIFVALMWSQFFYFILDRGVGVGDALSLSSEYMRGNKLVLFLIWILQMLINIGGALMCCVGLLFTMPFTVIMFPVVYLHITGQPTVIDRQVAQPQ